MKKIVPAILLALFALTLTACGPVVGTVVEKDFDEGGYNLKTNKWDWDEWDITVRDKDGHEREIEVSEEVFNSVDVGDTFDSSK